MGEILEGLTQWVIDNPSGYYMVAFAGILINSAIVALISVYLVINNALSWTAYLIIILGGVTLLQAMLYLIGRVTRKTRLGWRLYYKMKDKKFFQFYSYYLKTNTTKILIFGKFLPIAPLIVFTAGWYRVSFEKFIKTYLLGLTIWFLAMTSLFYFLISSLTYLQAKEVIKQVEILVTIIIVLILLGEYAIRKIIKKGINLEDAVKKFGEKAGKFNPFD